MPRYDWNHARLTKPTNHGNFNMKTKSTSEQRDVILTRLKSGAKCDKVNAMQSGIYNLSGRIAELRAIGNLILMTKISVRLKNGNLIQCGEYRLVRGWLS